MGQNHLIQKYKLIENNAPRNKAKECSLAKGVQLDFHNAISWGNQLLAVAAANFQLHRALRWTGGAGRSSPHFSGSRNQSPTLICCSFPNLWHADRHIGEGKPCQEPAAAASLCCKRKHVCSCMRVCMGLDREREREDEVMIPTLNPGQLTFPWRFLIKANVCPTKKASLGGWHLISSKNTHRHTSQIKAIYYLLKRLSGIHSPLSASLWPKRPFLICLTGLYNA